MTAIQIAYNATTKVVKLQMPGDAPGAGFVDLGDVQHPDAADVLDWSDNHKVWHHVRDLLYPLGQYDMQQIDIQRIDVTGLSVLPATAALAPAATQQLTPTVTPADASNRNVTYSTSDAAVATVDAAGLITAVADGEATITVTSADGIWKDTCVVTVTTP